MANLASLPHISVGGAVSTATHGSGDHNGNLACAVRSIDLMLSTGEIVSFDRSHPHFDGVVVGLGALGVGLSLHTEPTFDVAQTVHIGLPLQVGLEHFDAIMGSAYSVSWFTRWCDGLVDQVWTKAVVQPVSVRDRLSVGLDLSDLGAAPAGVPVHPVSGADSQACNEQLGVPGPWHERLPHFGLPHTPDSGDELQAELFVDRAVVVDAVRSLAAVGSFIAPALLVSEVRTIAADRLWLSPAFERDVVGFHFTWRSDWALVRLALAAVETALAPSELLPRWAKVTGLAAADVRGRFPGFERFLGLLDVYDPERVFPNPFFDRLVTGSTSRV
ncbi:MAG: FAD-binding protein [Actinomycetota bacterium]|nr:FAD-binding protein [Actinomycetota bacterium]